MRQSILVIILLFILGTVHSQTWPSLIYGDWEGTPSTTPLGPLTDGFKWHVRPLSNGGFMMWDNFTDTMITNSTQQFYSLGNTLFYCGWLYNFFAIGIENPTPIKVYFQLQSQTENTLVWCESPACSYLSWTITFSSDSLQLMVLLYPPVVHLSVTFTRLSSNATVIPFNGTTPDCKATPTPQKVAKCPFKEAMEKDKIAQKTPEHLKSYTFCYQLNDVEEFRIYWSLGTTDLIMVAISIPVNSATEKWAAIGFGSSFPGMNTSDIALGYITPSGTQCVRSMTALNYVGAPIDTTTVQLQDTQVMYTGGLMTIQFSRKLSEGHNPIPLNPPAHPPGYSIIWATGDNALTDCSGKPAYHSHSRGYRVINVMNPETVFDNYRRCTN